MKLLFKVYTIGLMTMFATLATAADSSKRAAKAEAEIVERFSKADVNRDGMLTRDEAKGVMPRVYSHFEEIDLAHKGAVSVDDIKSFMLSRMQERKRSP